MTGPQEDRIEVDPGIALLEQEIAVLARLLEALNRRRLYPLERAHYLLLLQLEAGPRRVGELSRALALDATTVTRQVAAMEARGLISRSPDPEDGRSALVEATEEGLRAAAEMRVTRRRRLARMLADWPAIKLRRYARLTRHLNMALMDRLSRPDEPLAPEGGGRAETGGSQADG